jgi:cytochrome c peroxidase
LYVGIGAVVAAGVAFYAFSDSGNTAIKSGVQAAKVKVNFVPTKDDYQKVRGCGLLWAMADVA